MKTKRKGNRPVILRDAESDAQTGRNFQFSTEIQEAMRSRLDEADAIEAEKKSGFAARNALVKAEREAKEKAERDAKQKADQERLSQYAAERDAKLKDEYRQRFLVAGGQPSEFDALWTASLREHALVQSVMTQATAAPKPRVSADL